MAFCQIFFNGIVVRTSEQDFLFEGNINEITIPMLPSTVTESPSTLPATISVQELLKPVAQAAEVWDVSLFDSHEKIALWIQYYAILIYIALYNRWLIKLDKL